MHFVPDSQQQWVTFVTEAAIGLPRSDRESLTELISGLPFELTMMQLSRILGELQPIRLDAHAQLALAHAVFHQHDLMEPIGAFIEGSQRRIVFGEQNLTALQRLLVLRGTDDAEPRLPQHQTGSTGALQGLGRPLPLRLAARPRSAQRRVQPLGGCSRWRH
jgi:hypothetical protein